MSDDRFTKLSKNYGGLFTEVFQVQGLDYDKLEHSVFEQVSLLNYNKSIPVLDIGVGTGKTSEAFIKAGYTNMTGFDLNPDMLSQTKAKYGEKITLIQGDATDLSMFEAGQFPIIISATTVHNIARTERIRFWAEIIRLQPEIIVMADKIAYTDPAKHKATFDAEVEAIHEVFGKRHNLPEAEETWIQHYDYDEREKLNLEEIELTLGKDYNIETIPASECGMMQTIVCTKK